VLLQRLATTRAIDRLRNRLRRREEAIDTGTGKARSNDPSKHAELVELNTALQSAVAQLPARQAEVFWLSEIADWNHQQIAEQLGISAGSMAVILHRTRQKLQELLKMQSRMSAALKAQRTA